jgi:hypothetical protein
MKRPCLVQPLCLLILATVCLAGDKQDNKLPQEVEDAMDHAKEAYLYSLDPAPLAEATPDTFHGHHLHGRIKLGTHDRKLSVETLRNAVASWKGRVALCFNPRHGLRVISDAHTYDVLICYECMAFQVLRDDRPVAWGGLSGSSDTFNDLLEAGNVALPYEETKAGRAEARKKMAAREKKHLENEKRWRAAMPTLLRQFALEPSDRVAERTPGFKSLKGMHDLVLQEFPDSQKRCLALFGWYGSGEGSWSHFYSYEQVPEELLQMEAIPELIGAAHRDDLTQTQLEGAARFFVTCARSQDILKAMPDSLKKKVLEHCIHSPDVEKRDLARRVLGD